MSAAAGNDQRGGLQASTSSHRLHGVGLSWPQGARQLLNNPSALTHLRTCEARGGTVPCHKS